MHYEHIQAATEGLGKSNILGTGLILAQGYSRAHQPNPVLSQRDHCNRATEHDIGWLAGKPT